MHKFTALMLIAGLLVACAPTVVNPPMDLAERFRLTAFRGDDGQVIDLHKWTTRLVAVLVFGANEREHDQVRDHMDLLGNLTGLGFYTMEAGSIDGSAARAPVMLRQLPLQFQFEEFSVITVFIGSRTELLPLAREFAELLGHKNPNIARYTFTCFGAAQSAAGVVVAGAYIRNDLPGENTRGCIAQEISQVLGLPGDLDNRTDTNFTSQNGTPYLTAADRALLMILYDDRLEVGMTWDEARPIVRQIIQERYPAGP